VSTYVAYYRVSTASQGRSGLGLAAQETKIAQFLSPDDELLASFIEVESGKSDTRIELWKAIAFAKKHQAKILIAKLDRFSRKVSFIASIMEQGIQLVVAEMPNASDFQLHIFAALAQEERRMISERTRNALAEAKKRGVKLGTNGKLLAIQRKLEASERADRLRHIVQPLLEQGRSYSGIARHLNETGILSAKGSKFYPETVKAVVLRLEATA